MDALQGWKSKPFLNLLSGGRRVMNVMTAEEPAAGE